MQGANELFICSTCIYLNLAYKMGGKKEWQKYFNQIMQEKLDGLYTALKGEKMKEYINAFAAKEERAQW